MYRYFQFFAICWHFMSPSNTQQVHVPKQENERSRMGLYTAVLRDLGRPSRELQCSTLGICSDETNQLVERKPIGG